MRLVMRLVFSIVLFSWSNVLFAVDYYVGGAGASDSNPGTASQPFATIQKAASVAKAGDVVNVRSGTYRETITPANSGAAGSPITYQAESGATVIISGADPVTSSWSVHSGNIYKTTFDLGEPLFDEFMTGFNNEKFDYNNSEMLAQQIFQNGEMQFLAQWPKVSSPDGLIERETSRGKNKTNSFTQNSINDAALSTLGDLNGAYVWVNGWFLSYTRTINSHSGTTINFNTTDADIQFSRFYRVFGKLNLLTAEREWYWDDASNTLYLYQAGGGTPTNVEFKQRNWGFDLKNKSNITIKGLQFFACEPVTTNAASVNTIIDNIKAKYTNHSVLETKGGADGYHDSAVQTGLKLLGSGSVVRNSEFRHMAGMGIWAGSNTTIENNYFYNGSYTGQYSGFIKPIWGAGNIKILNNTFTKSGRGAIEFTPENSASNLNIEIAYNDFSYFNMLNVDGGCIYSSRGLDMTGTRIHHNWFHNDGGYDEMGTGKQAGIQVNGVYLDQAAGPVTLDHNVFWNGMDDGADFYNDITYEGRTATGTLVYNNTFASVNKGTAFSYATYDTSPHDVQRNNIYRMGILINWGASPGNVANALLSGVSPNFVGSGNSGLVFRLNAGSPAINAGTTINGITDGSVGAPDIGAYEFGGTEWVPGYKPVSVSVTPNTPPTVAITAPTNNTSVAPGTTINITANASDNGSVTKVEFFDGTTKLGEDTTSPYSFAWNGATAGTHTLTAKATDNAAATTTSAPITITVTAAANAKPTITLTSPLANSQSQAGTAINITATATDTDGTVTKVEFFDGATKLGEDISSPYTFNWASPSAGTHVLTVKATDNSNNVTTSTAVTITVVAPAGGPTVSITSPANNASFTFGSSISITATAAATSGTVSKVEFFDGATKLGEDTTSPYAFTWASPAAGTHVLTAKATDNSNKVTTSAQVTVTVAAANGPTVAITSPANNASFASGASIDITATAAAVSGTVSKVEFFAGSVKLGEDTTSPYAFTWASPSAGTHVLTAKATDSSNKSTTSSGVSVVVESPVGLTVSITSPSNNSTSAIGAAINITASAEISSGSISKVEFFEGDTKLGEDLDAPYTYSWTGAASGTYVLTAVASDAKGATATSAPVTVTVNAAETPDIAATDLQAGIPRYFSPNNDGTGDVWAWAENPAYTNAALQVYNRSGQKVYEAPSYANSWSGNSTDGRSLQDGDYYYIAQLTNGAVLKGAVRIVR
ncbi:Ig-like domain-containing protein [Chryseolinea sp. T2]|uniref:Ig-like domain-containing protein n=1 Tax=Chryseolinea sp. T2 TaxID=3129255 RepID=UPI0030770ED6